MTQTCRKRVRARDRREGLQAWQVSGPRDLGSDRRSYITIPGRICLVLLRHAWHKARFLVSSSHYGPLGPTCTPEKKEVQRKDASARQRKDKEIVEG